ncbi:MAG: hypothetical protein ACFFCZ_00125 [Promethearchaeota archaeon]
MIKIPISKEKWVSKINTLKKSTDEVLDLQHDWYASNGWGLKELLIHLEAWDEEYLCVLEALKHGKAYVAQYRRFPDYKEEDQMTFLDHWNNQILAERSKLSQEKVRDLFIQTRRKVLKKFEELWSDETGLQFPDFAVHIDDLSAHDTKHIEKGLKTN